MSTSCRDHGIRFCVFITIVRRRPTFFYLWVQDGAGADAGLLTSWLTGFNFWQRLSTLPGLLALNNICNARSKLATRFGIASGAGG